jgi:predicted RNA-binding Zn ribbon-like protein
MIIFLAAMSKLTSIEGKQLAALETRVELALQAAANGRPPAPEALRELLVEALAQLRALESGSEARPNAVESLERALAALEAWQRWRPPTQPTA